MTTQSNLHTTTNNPATTNTIHVVSDAVDPAPASTGSSSRSPSHVAYHVREFGTGDRKKSTWTRIGSAWTHRDGQGFNLQIECLPIDGRISLRVASEKKE